MYARKNLKFYFKLLKQVSETIFTIVLFFTAALKFVLNWISIHPVGISHHSTLYICCAPAREPPKLWQPWPGPPSSSYKYHLSSVCSLVSD